MVLELMTLKSKSLPDQAQIIGRLRRANPQLGAATLRLLREKPKSRITQYALTESEDYVCTAALLAVAFSDIASVPDSAARLELIESFSSLCELLNIEMRDVELLLEEVSAIESLIDDETG